jgi:hypothetical protein
MLRYGAERPMIASRGCVCLLLSDARDGRARIAKAEEREERLRMATAAALI